MPKVPNPSPRTKKLTYAQIKDGWRIDPCPTCRGSGRRGARKCGLCGGGGTIATHKG